MIDFDMSIDQNFKMFQSELFKFVFVQGWGDGIFELVVESENDSSIVAELHAFTDDELNSKLSDAFTTFVTSSSTAE